MGETKPVEQHLKSPIQRIEELETKVKELLEHFGEKVFGVDDKTATDAEVSK